MRMSRATGVGRIAAALGTVAVTLTAACSSDPPTGPELEAGIQVHEDAGVVFLTQNVIPEAIMGALFEGRVLLDDEECLRLDYPDAHTAIWPLGYQVVVEGEEIRVLDRDGEHVGTVGGEFALPGGEVTELSDAMGFDQDDRDLAASRCPGRYWIVG